MDINNADKLYLSDPLFHALVASLEQAIIDLQMTPSEIREAAMYACVRVEDRRTKLYFPKEARP
jgi:hypothetical protein